jgi:AcrR family transcriptional regulator
VSPKPPFVGRRARVAQTDQAILNATIAILNRSGYAALTLNAIARDCGKSTTTVTKRFATPTESAAAAWRAHYGAIAVRDLQELLRHAGLLDEPGDPNALIGTLEALHQPNPDWRSISELLLISAFEPPLREAISHDLRGTTQRWCTPNPPHPNPILATQRAYVLILGLGLTLIGAHPNRDHGDIHSAFHTLQRALRNPSAPQTAPSLIAAMPLEANHFDFHTQDPRERQLLTALLEVIAERGIDRATTQAIALAAHSNEGLLFNRYASKIDAFLDAMNQHQRLYIQKQNAAALALSAEHPAALVDTAVIQRSLHPDREAPRAVAMEYLRMTRYHPHVAEHLTQTQRALREQILQANPTAPHATIDGWLSYGLAIGAGLGILPLLLPEAHRLPYNVVLEPLLTP